MKLPALLATTVLLASCAAPSSDTQWQRLYDEDYLRDEQKWPMTLGQVQQALFAHEAACGSAAKFEIDAIQPNIAYVWHQPEQAPAISNSILLEIARLYGNTLRVRVYAHLDVHRQDIQRLNNQILTPDVCD